MYTYIYEHTNKYIQRKISNGMSVWKCQRWFNKFKNSDFAPLDMYRSERLTTLNDDAVQTAIEVGPHQSYGDLFWMLNEP